MAEEPFAVDQFQVDVTPSGDALFVALSGDLDARAAETVRDALSEITGSSVVVDLGPLTLLDSSGLSTLVAAKRRIEESGYSFDLVNARGRVRRSFQIIGLEHLLAQ